MEESTTRKRPNNILGLRSRLSGLRTFRTVESDKNLSLRSLSECGLGIRGLCLKVVWASILQIRDEVLQFRTMSFSCTWKAQSGRHCFASREPDRAHRRQLCRTAINCRLSIPANPEFQEDMQAPNSMFNSFELSSTPPRKRIIIHYTSCKRAASMRTSHVPASTCFPRKVSLC